VVWVAIPSHAVLGVALIVAAALQAVRLIRWAGDRTISDRLVLVLHVAYSFIPIGFALLGISIIDPTLVPASAGIHAWTAGAFGMMTLAIMTRASLGHTGQPLTADIGTQAIYLLVFCAAILRIVAAFNGSMVLIAVASVAWVAAFGGFVMLYGPGLAGRPPAWAGR
jgi:uncharacterized protein involved in response to NO